MEAESTLRFVHSSEERDASTSFATWSSLKGVTVLLCVHMHTQCNNRLSVGLSAHQVIAKKKTQK